MDKIMTKNNNSLNCYIIGESSLLIQCIIELQKQGFKIFGIISSDQTVIEWAKSKEIDSQLPKNNIIEFLKKQPFSYLFSIANIALLPKEVIESPSCYAINYHDALLPAYAGLNATSWAIINQEKKHGVTWHTMTEEIDSGEILKQAIVEISEEETAFTLNGKCYEAAIASFSEMIDELRQDNAVLTKQDFTKRSYFSRSRQSSNGCLISWNRDAHKIHALVRGLDFGPYPNPLGVAKFFIDNNTIIVSQTKITNVPSASTPGTIIAIQDNFVTVTTTNYDIELHELMTVRDQHILIADFVTQFKLHEGYQFEDVTPENQKQIAALDAKIARYEAFWVNRLSTLQPLEVPYINYTNLRADTDKLETIRLPISNEISEFLTTIFPDWNTSNFISAVFIAYLARIGENLTFDIGIKNTEFKNDFKGLEALFSSYIPCHITVDKEQAFKNVLLAIQEQITSSQHRKTYLHDTVVRYPKLERLENTPFSIIIETAENLNSTESKQVNDLTFTVQEDGKEYAFSYNTTSLTQDAALNMVDQFTVFVKNIINQHNIPLAKLSLLSNEAYQQILDNWNHTQTDYPNNTNLSQLFETQVEKTPNAIAITFENQQLTYKELNDKANQVAHYLQTLNVGPEILVGLCVDRSLDMLIGVLGILKAGGAYLPLDPTYPSGRVSFMLEDAGIDVLLTQQKWRNKLSEMTTATLVCLDSQWETIAQESETNPINKAGPNNLIYIIYTSGSTGRPKGVQITHQAFINFLYAMHQSVGLDKQDILLAVTTLSFDIAGLELHLPLITGAQIKLVSRETALDGLQLLDNLTTSKTTVMQATPATWQMLINVGWKNTPHLKILCGGEALSRPLAGQLLERGNSVWNLYGPTETTVWSSVYQVKPQIESGQNTSELIGRPIANTQLYILDHYLQPTPVGIPGELHIGGDGLARGYLNRLELTNEKFIPNPFSENPDSRLYKTGDLVRYRPDSNIEYISRIDHQVKIRGFRIEIGEIESQLRKHTAVREAVVVAQEYPPGSQNLIAYVVLKQTQSDILSEQLLNHLREILPDYMIPSLLMMLDAMPLTPNGKVDRRSLPLPKENLAHFSQAKLVISPDFSTEQKLTAIWSYLLRREQIDNDEKFFEIGGNSLLATEVILKIRDIFSVQLPVSKLFESSTIAKLTRVVDTILVEKTVVNEPTEKDQESDDEQLLAMLRGLADDKLELDDVAKHLDSI